ncbi:unnamed protein product [Thelazia callipaeda]|uniref:PHD-type domain-containing protein n=1 Tax=Thelazia callipaeda TaxID=103827 RepID=A0A0N5D9G6_THECL|nr:unnamed protein product [Thelazia callipaeda]
MRDLIEEMNDGGLSHENEDITIKYAKCRMCGKSDNEHLLLLCDGVVGRNLDGSAIRCNVAYHSYCLPEKLDTIPEGDWFCPFCADKQDRENSEMLSFIVSELTNDTSYQNDTSELSNETSTQLNGISSYSEFEDTDIESAPSSTTFSFIDDEVSDFDEFKRYHTVSFDDSESSSDESGPYLMSFTSSASSSSQKPRHTVVNETGTLTTSTRTNVNGGRVKTEQRKKRTR